MSTNHHTVFARHGQQFERQLNRHRYCNIIISSAEFAETMEALRLNQRDMKAQGKGGKPMSEETNLNNTFILRMRVLSNNISCNSLFPGGGR